MTLQELISKLEELKALGFGDKPVLTSNGLPLTGAMGIEPLKYFRNTEDWGFSAGECAVVVQCDI